MVNISKDDILDVSEMTLKLEKEFNNILDGNDKALAISALVGTMVGTIVSQCETIEEIAFYKFIVNDVFEIAIKKRLKKD